MYNEEIKTKFIRSYTSSISSAKVYVTIFNSIAPYEEKWEADLCTKEEQDLQPVIDNIVGLRSRSKWSRLIMLKDYVNWCINIEKVPNACDGMLKINSVGLDKIRKQTVANPPHLQEYLGKLYDAEDDKTIDNIYRCYYWLAYGGVSEEDILGIKCSDVDLENMVIHYKDTEIPIYREAIRAFKNCIELTQFVYNHPNYTKTVWRNRVDGDTLVRGFRALPSIKTMRVEISRHAKAKEKDTGKRLSYYRTWISGIFFRAYERERMGEKLDFDKIVDEQMKGKTYKLDSGHNTQDAKKRKLVNDYIEDYQRWKFVFK